MEKQDTIDLLIEFQLFLNGNGLIPINEWEYKREAKKFIHKLEKQANDSEASNAVDKNKS